MASYKFGKYLKLVLVRNFGRLQQWLHSPWDFLYWEGVFITDSISIWVMGPHNFSMFTWLDLFMCSEVCWHLDFPICWHISIYSNSSFFFFSCVCCNFFFHAFLIALIYFLCRRWKVVQSVVYHFIFSKESALNFTDFFVYLLVCFFSNFNYFFLLIFCPRSLGCTNRSFNGFSNYWNFIITILIALNLILNTASAVFLVGMFTY